MGLNHTASAETSAARKWRWRILCVSVGCVASLLTVAIMLPAAWVTPLFASATGGRVELSDPQGSLWHGSAHLMLSAGERDDSQINSTELGQGATLMPYRVTWHARILPLFWGRLQLTMQEDRPLSLPILIDAQAGQITLYSGSMGVPASILVGLGAPFNTLDLQGDVRLSWTDWRLLGHQAYGQLVVDVRDASSRVSRLKPLGTYQATLNGEGQSATLRLATLSGPLQLSGNGRLQGGHVDFSGRAESRPDALPDLSGLLNMLGRRVDEHTALLELHQ